MHTDYPVVIIGGGVTGSAVAYVANQYSNIGRVLLLEKYDDIGKENSHPLNNSQTSHDGGTETNYSLEHALEVKHGAIMLRTFVESKSKLDPKLFQKTYRMVLGVGPDEVSLLTRRFYEFREHYPDLELIDGSDLFRVEPKIMEGRNPDEKVCALVSSEGYAIDYQRLAQHFLNDAGNTDLCLNTKVLDIIPHDDATGFTLHTSKKTFTTKAVIAACGPYSLTFAQNLGYGKEYGILPVAGSFYSTGNFLRGKVYRVQKEGMPFAEIHGDPDVLNPLDTRFGPTTKPLPLMERRHYETFWDYMRTPIVSLRGVRSLFNIIRDNQLMGYVMRNWLYDTQGIGPLLFLHEIRKIIPTIRYRDLKRRKGAGGIRPQIVNLVTGKLEMGNKIIEGNNSIFITTPSPGASVCLANAEHVITWLVSTLGKHFYFDTKKFQEELNTRPYRHPFPFSMNIALNG